MKCFPATLRPLNISRLYAPIREVWCLLGVGLSSWQLSGILGVTVIPFES